MEHASKLPVLKRVGLVLVGVSVLLVVGPILFGIIPLWLSKHTLFGLSPVDTVIGPASGILLLVPSLNLLTFADDPEKYIRGEGFKHKYEIGGLLIFLAVYGARAFCDKLAQLSSRPSPYTTAARSAELQAEYLDHIWILTTVSWAVVIIYAILGLYLYHDHRSKKKVLPEG